MNELKVGTKIRILEKGKQPPYAHAGDIGIITVEKWDGLIPDTDGDYWADFNHCGNPYVHLDGFWCVGKPNVDFEILGESV